MNHAAALPLMVCSAVASIALAATAGKTVMDAHQFAEKAKALFVDGKAVEVQKDSTNAILAGLFGVVALGSLVWWVSGGSEDQTVPQAAGVATLAATPVAATAPIQPSVRAYSPDISNDRYAWVEDVLNHPFLLIWGSSGSGKSTAAEWVCYERLRRGHEVKIFDPHAKYGQWAGLELIGKGMQYEAVDRGLKDVILHIEARYRQQANEPNFNPRPISVLCEEMTSWSFRCPDSAGEFFRTSLSDLRKVKYKAVYVSHDRTLEALGGGKGIAKAKDMTLLELQLFSQLDPNGGEELIPTGKGELKYPSGKKIEVDIPEYFRNPTRPVSTHFDSAKSVSSLISPAETVTEQTLEPDLEKPVSSFVSPVEIGEICPDRVNRVLEMKRAGLSQTQIISIEWSVKPGKSQAYETARAEYQLIIDSYGGNN